MITSLKAFTKSAGPIAWPPITEANANGIPVLEVPTDLNLSGNSMKKKRQSRRRSSSYIRCHYTVNEKGVQKGLMYRRQLLLASTSLPLKPQQMMAAMPSPLSLTDYHKLENAVLEANKSKETSYGRPEFNDVVCWLRSAEPLKPQNSKNPHELSGVIAASRPRELLPEINEVQVVTARVRRPAALKQMKDKEEELVLEGIEVTNEKPLCFHVYIKLGQVENDEEEGLYAGTFSHMPPRPKQRRRHNDKPVLDGDRQQKRSVRMCCLRLGINGILIHPHNLDAHKGESVIVRLVPTLKVDEDPIRVESIFIEYT